MFSKLITKIKLYAAPMTRHSELSPEQIAVITQFARGDTACRNKAIAIFRDARFHGIAIESHPAMGFMFEIEHSSPDLVLREIYRNKLLQNQ
jgi:hypothetical protein